MRCCAEDEGFVALRSRPAGGGFKPPHAALVIRPRLTGVFNVAQRTGAPPVMVAGDWLSSPRRQRLQRGGG